MRETAPHTVPPPGRGSGRDVPGLMVPVAVLLTLVAASGLVEQVIWPYVRRDDWPYLLPAGAPGAADPMAKVEEEGRWGNWAWWFVAGRHGSPVTAAVLLVAGYTAFTVGLWRLFRVPGVVAGALLAAALFVSPLWVRLVYWPGTLSASAIVAAAGVWSLPWAARRPRTLAGWLLAVGLLGVLTYPPVGGLLLICAVVHLRDRPWKHVVLVAGGYVGGVAVGVVLATVLNGIAFGRMGLDIAEWRNPNRPTDVHDLVVNARRHARQGLVLVRTLGPAAVVGLVSALVALVDPRSRRVLLRVGLAVAVVASLELAQTLSTGVRTNVRGSLWAWPAVVLPAACLLLGSPALRRLGQVLLLVLAVIGAVAWHADVATHQSTKRAYDALVATAVPTDTRQLPQVVFYQDPVHRRSTRGRITAGTLRMMFLEQEGVVVRWCRPAECRALADLAAHGPVHDLGAVTGVVVPAPPAVL